MTLCLVDFWVVLFLIFVILPFTYYYAEEVLVSEDGASLDMIFGRVESSDDDEEIDTAEMNSLRGPGAKIRRWIRAEGGSVKKGYERVKRAIK